MSNRAIVSGILVLVFSATTAYADMLDRAVNKAVNAIDKYYGTSADQKTKDAAADAVKMAVDPRKGKYEENYNNMEKHLRNSAESSNQNSNNSNANSNRNNSRTPNNASKNNYQVSTNCNCDDYPYKNATVEGSMIGGKQACAVKNSNGVIYWCSGNYCGEFPSYKCREDQATHWYICEDDGIRLKFWGR